MLKNKVLSSPLPVLDGRALDFVKIAAALCMVVDHVNYMLLDGRVVEMFFIGRITFPLFCYAAAIAALRAGDKAYAQAGRLLILAALSEPVSQLVRDNGGAVNVIFTLAAGVALAAALPRLPALARAAIFLLGAGTNALLPNAVEFGVAGMLLPAAILMILRGDRSAIFFAALLVFMANASQLWPQMQEGQAHMLLGAALTTAIWAAVPGTALIFVAQKLPQHGRMMRKYALHVFYPGHLIALRIAALFLR